MRTLLPTSSLVRWSLQRGNRRVTCHLTSNSDTAGFRVATVPEWAGGKSVTETFDALGAALCRHAAITSRLRDAGWHVAAYTT